MFVFQARPTTITMDAGITAHRRYPQAEKPSTNGKSPSSSSANNGGSRSMDPATPNKHVNFSGHSEEKKREKFLTAKYGAHQMALIRKRLRVEMWMYERLQELYGCEDGGDVEIDLDEVLDMDSEMERRQYINVST